MVRINEQRVKPTGRPPRAGKAATRNVTIRITDDEHKAFTRAAKAAGVTLGDWLRTCANERAGKER